MTPDAPTRLRQRVARLLDDRGITQRAMARALGHGDQWASNFLTGRNQLAWDDVDKIARFLNVPPGELVRVSDEPWELTPTETRMVRAMRMLPVVIRDHLVAHADFLIGATPPEVDLLVQIRTLDAEEQAQLQHWLNVVTVSQGVPRRTTTPEGHPLTAPPRSGEAQRGPKRKQG